MASPPVIELPQVHRAPLGLPPGSVRAVIALLIGGLFWGLVFFHERAEKIPLAIYFLLCLELLFFVAHGHTIGPADAAHPNPWWLPRGFFRILIMLGFLLSIGWQLVQDPDRLLKHLTPTEDQLRQWPYLLFALGGGFMLGRLLRLGPWHRSPAFQDFLAWVSLVSILALGAEILLVAFVIPGLPRPPDLSLWEYFLTAVVACYFGLRC